MKDDVRKVIYSTIGVFLVGVLIWIGIVYVNACGFTLSCTSGKLKAVRTPVPTLIPATMPVMQPESQSEELGESGTCYVAAADLVGAWVDAGASDTESFQFTDANGMGCEAAFEDVKPLFIGSNLWYTGSLSCISCHSVDLAVSPAQLDLSSYDGIVAGSRRADAAAKGTDILGGGDWKASLLYQFINEAKADVPGHTEVLSDLMIYAGKPLPIEATPTP
ncbi:MAG TPA: hypothetical protein PKL78_00690 [Anaerolineales bacterium]|nr:hypothetical protein [Anaerolineales bacterium]HNN12044.1 hypothetical protein [Anaerolineales bacterium]HNO31394.1 hypothetical protein [Anaerolineales bacterium]